MSEELETGLTQEEHTRLQKYNDLVKGSAGRIDLLTGDEQRDMKQLLKKSMLYQGVHTEDELAEL